ncbi:MAG TPA: zf-HC2 domain-containing protein [Patescibacteria group bacterium]|nr:zf-HC2 domain-containing protein [Patescibacteria group bacterium]
MTCTETRDLFSALADDALTPAERAALDAHLAGCAECRRELAGLLRTVKLVRAIDPERAPAGFVDRVLAAARPEPARKRLARRLLAPWPTLPLGAAALFLVAGLAVLLFRGSPEQQQAARYQPPTPGPVVQAPTPETAPSTGPAAPRETGSSATTAPREIAPAAPPSSREPTAPQRSRELEALKNRVEQPAPAEKRAETRAEPLSAPRRAAPPAEPPRAMAERQVATPPAVEDGRRAKVDQAQRPPASERFSSAAQDTRADAAKDTAKEGKLRQESPASAPPVGAAGVVPSVAAKSQMVPQIAPLSRTGPMTGVPAAPPDVTAQLRVPDVAAAELSLIELATRVGGRQTGRRIDGGRVVVELAVPRDAYAQFVREATALGAVSIESQATDRPVLAVAVTVSN